MENKITIAGFGGQGVMLIGQLLGYSATHAGKNATYYPSYGPEMRGGTANCTVVVSDDQIGSPVPDEVDVLVAMNEPSLRKFENKVIPGGTIILNGSIVKTDVERKDVKVVRIPANDIAFELGAAKSSNMVILGAYLGVSGIIEKEMVFETMKVAMARKAAFFDSNKAAINKGIDFIKN